MSSLLHKPFGLNPSGRLCHGEVYLSVVSEASWAMVEALRYSAGALHGFAGEYLCIDIDLINRVMTGKSPQSTAASPSAVL